MATTQVKEFFNLHVSGIGYMNRVRWVTPSNRGGRRSEPFLACSISALRGSSDEPAYTYFDLRVSGQEAIEIVDKLGHDVAAKRKVIVSFRVGDIYPHVYERDVRDDQGRATGDKETASLIKGRLLIINTVKVDGELVYNREKELSDEGTDLLQEEQVEKPAEPAPKADPKPKPAPRQAERPVASAQADVAVTKPKVAARARSAYAAATA